MDEQQSSETQPNLQTATTELPTPVPPQQELATKKQSRFRLTKKQIIITIIVAALCAVGAVSWFVFIKKDTTKNNTADTTNTQDVPLESQDTTSQQEASVTISKLSGNTYFAVPKKVANLHFYKNLSYYGSSNCDTDGNNCTPTYTDADLSYYQIGTTKENQAIYMVHSVAKDIDGGIQQLAIETAPNTYMLLMQPVWTSDGKPVTTVSKELTDSLNTGVTTNLSIVFAELSFPKEVVVNGQKLSTDYAQPQFMPEGIKSLCVGAYCSVAKPDQSIEKIGDASGYTFYRTNYKNETNFRIIELDGVYASMFDVSYHLNGELSSVSEKLPITWSTGDKDQISAYSGGAGCGSTGYVVAKDTTGLMQVGTSKSGQKVYQLPADAALTKELYETDYNKGEGAENASLKNLTMQQFLDKHSFFLVENSFNEYVVFQRSDVFIRGGCGKPVVYLYPTVATNVSVKVGADVVKSDPFYTADGWQNVLAQPNGKLTYKGASYDSLFWEGYGQGTYPSITEGTVVRTFDAASTIRTQLAQQGFIQKEIDDFMAYWQPKLPTTPYVRLTWFGTSTMNQLAPLAITPKPQTLIRTFLDFEGLQNPIQLPSQTFSTKARSGFTVTEWGGLLREGIR